MLKDFIKKLRDRRVIKRIAVKGLLGAFPYVGSIIKDVIDEWSEYKKEELLKELKELSEKQLKEISEELNVSVEILENVLEITSEYLDELRGDHRKILEGQEEIKELIKQKGLSIPTIQEVLRKDEAKKADFFKKEPEWVDFEQGFVVEREEVGKIIKALEKDKIHLVVGKLASGKSVILKNVGFKLANEGKKVYFVELKRYSEEEVKELFNKILLDLDAVFIVDDAHFFVRECERLVRGFKNNSSKLIIGARETDEILSKHPKVFSEFERLNRTEVNAKDVTEKMIETFLKRKYNFSDERVERVSENLERYKEDLWFLSWALKVYSPEKDVVEEEEIYRKVEEVIRNLDRETGKYDELNAEDVFLPLSTFYRFEIPVEKQFLINIGIDETLINRLVNLSEVIETREFGKRPMLSLHHSSIAEIYFKTYKMDRYFGENVKRRIKDEFEKIVNKEVSDQDFEYPSFTST